MTTFVAPDARELPGPGATADPCAGVVERAQAWIDGELDVGAVATLRAHMAACPSCRRVVEAERRFLRAVHARTHLEHAPAALRARVRTLLRAGA